MRELKAFVRDIKVDEVVEALIRAHAPGVTVSHVQGLGYGYDPIQYTFAPGVMGKAPRVAKVEVVCRDEDVDRLVQAIVGVAQTGMRGDGIVFITPVHSVVRIRTGEEGLGAE